MADKEHDLWHNDPAFQLHNLIGALLTWFDLQLLLKMVDGFMEKTMRETTRYHFGPTGENVPFFYRSFVVSHQWSMWLGGRFPPPHQMRMYDGFSFFLCVWVPLASHKRATFWDLKAFFKVLHKYSIWTTLNTLNSHREWNAKKHEYSHDIFDPFL